ncbi:predicted protein [Aspergillus terreus NIH2624]|uniref:DUF7779 domain-containing protein n=1 Tax=Aspergillus terreus (strain NIH 2624 / FGSC A1156) TaxID=341663 RepID=Q0C8S2_ASPTN|nr:uncharacterized protein ATEG_09912 [Aspergillus terreus NIH2624]EAU30103.1 predicted protein [Aspergillus terreus NIH2624]
MASRKKSHVFRVTGLSREQPDDDLQNALQETLHDNLTDDERSQIQAEITVVPSCYESDTQRVALVQFRGGVPQFLYKLKVDPLEDWQVEMGDTDTSFDRHFFGFTQLYAPDENKPVVADIIAITGLDGHAYGSWQGRGNLGRMWLRDFLSKDLPQCRTMIYGYNSKLSIRGVDTILDYGRGLMEEIKKIRHTKECLVRAIQTMEGDHPAITSLYRATYGMLLFAIPHKGLDSESGRWKRTGDFVTTVGADSALLQLPDHEEDKVPLNADHSTVVKFKTRTEEGYQTALINLRQFLEEAPSVVAARFKQMRQKPQPQSTVPFKRDLTFVGREAVIGGIKEKHGAIGQRHERVALVGLAGVGKTQAAIEYAYRLVYRWLCDARNGRWLMVLDNADDDGGFFRGNASDERGLLVRFLPQAAHGFMLITSRNRFAARNLVGSDGDVITVQPMNEEESVALLRLRLLDPPSGESGEDERALVQALEYIPLALIQTAAYIANRSPLINVSAYLRLFHESESKRMRLLQTEDSTDLRRDPSIRYAVITTWQLSFKQIRQEQPAATDLLALMSMFDRQGIPENLVRDSDQDELDFHDALAPLLSYSLVRLERDERLFDMHLLVQLSVRAWLQQHQQLQGWQVKSRGIMARAFPDGNYESWTQCRSLLAHAKSVLTSINDADDNDRLNAAALSSHCGRFLELQGAYEEAKAMHRQALEAREKVLGREHPSTLISVSNLGNVLFSQGKYEEAETIHRQALEGSEKILGREHPSTLASVSNVGNVLFSQGKYKEAKAVHRRALGAREKILGREHPDTLTSVSNLGSVLSRQGKYEEAEAMHRRALEGCEREFGREHPSTLASVSNVGNVLFSQGKYEEAKAVHRRALGAREKILGREHPDTLTSVSNLGSVLSRQGKYEEAEAMHRRALEGYEREFGREHPSALTSVSNLGGVLDSQGKYEEAEAMCRRALEAREKVLGREHPDTLTSVSGLSCILSIQGKYEEAESVLRRALEGYKKVLGWKYNEAETMHRRALEGSEKVLGREHPDTLTSVSDLGCILNSQGKYEEAEAMHRLALEAREQMHGCEHPTTLTSVSNLGNVLLRQGKCEEAEALHRRALGAREKILRREHPDTLTSVNNLGFVLDRQGIYEEAEAMHRQALGAREKMLGREHPTTLTSVSNLGNVLLRQGKYEEAEAMHRRAWEAGDKDF